MKSRSATI